MVTLQTTLGTPDVMEYMAASGIPESVHDALRQSVGATYRCWLDKITNDNGSDPEPDDKDGLTGEWCPQCNEALESVPHGASTVVVCTGAKCTYEQNRHFLPALQKASCDEFHYALRTKTGDTFVFRHCNLYRDFVDVLDITGHTIKLGMSDSAMGVLPLTFDRGVEIPYENIAWVCDAPWGS